MLARWLFVAIILAAPLAQAADLAIRAVVIKSARVTVQSPQRIAVSEREPGSVQVTVQPAGEDAVRVVFTP